MAAGGYGRGTGIPLHARTRSNAPDQPEPAPEEDPCPARHCWVTVPVDGGTARPGLLLGWRREGLGESGGTAPSWLGLVVYPARLRSGEWSTVCEWLPAVYLSPGGPGPAG